jgi:hypothetical protein
MRYKSPPLPVDLAVVNREQTNDGDNDSVIAKFAALSADDSSGINQVVAMFEKNH